MSDTPYYEVLDPPTGYKDFHRLQNYLCEWMDPPYPPVLVGPPPHGEARLTTNLDPQGMLTNNTFRTC